MQLLRTPCCMISICRVSVSAQPTGQHIRIVRFPGAASTVLVMTRQLHCSRTVAKCGRLSLVVNKQHTTSIPCLHCL
jgi:hypothetical protein